MGGKQGWFISCMHGRCAGMQAHPSSYQKQPGSTQLMLMTVGKNSDCCLHLHGAKQDMSSNERIPQEAWIAWGSLQQPDVASLNNDYHVTLVTQTSTTSKGAYCPIWLATNGACQLVQAYCFYSSREASAKWHRQQPGMHCSSPIGLELYKHHSGPNIASFLAGLPHHFLIDACAMPTKGHRLVAVLAVAFAFDAHLPRTGLFASTTWSSTT